MDVPPALFHPLEARVLLLSSEPASAVFLRQWLQPLALPVDSLPLAEMATYGFDKSDHKVIVIELGRAAREQAVAAVRRIRQDNTWTCVLVMMNSVDSHARQACIHAGADHVLKLPGAADERAAFYLELFNDPDYWNLDPPVLDPARLCLQSREQRLDLTFIQVQTLLALLYAPGHLLSLDDLAGPLGLNVRSYDVRVMEKFFSRLRSAIRKTFGINVIHNMRGEGYRLTRGSIAAAPMAFRG